MDWRKKKKKRREGKGKNQKEEEKETLIGLDMFANYFIQQAFLYNY